MRLECHPPTPIMNSLRAPDGTINRAYAPDFTGCLLPYCQWYQDDFLGGVRGMTAAEVGVYTILLCEMYARGVALNMPEARLARACGLPAAKFRAILAMLVREGKIIALDAGLWNERVDETLLRRQNEHLNNSRAGSYSARKRKEIKGTIERPLNDRSTVVQPISEAHIYGGGGGGDGNTRARTREPPPRDASAKAQTFREALLVAMGADPVSGLTGPNGKMIGTQVDMIEADRWVSDLGLTESECIAQVVAVMASKRDGPPNGFNYFTPAMIRLAGAKLAPPIHVDAGGRHDATPGRARRNVEDPFVRAAAKLAGIG